MCVKEKKVKSLSPTLWDPMDCSLPGLSIHGILQARILEWVAISFSKRSSQPRDWTRVSRIVGIHFTIWANSNWEEENKCKRCWGETKRAGNEINPPLHEKVYFKH